jgi:hypothetical protein
MARRIVALVSALVLVWSTAGMSPAQTRAGVAFEAAPVAACAAPDHPTHYTSDSTDVLVCTSTIQSGSTLRIVITARKGATVQVQLKFPDGTTAPDSGSLTVVADKKGIARASLPIHYNPVTNYAQAELTVTVLYKNRSDVVTGSVTIAQSAPLASTVLRARPRYMSSWCPDDQAACSIRNGSVLIIQIVGNPRAQVSAKIVYPDSTSVGCYRNELTSTSLTNDSGVYRCQLPVVYQPKASDQGTSLTVVAQLSLGDYTAQPVSLTLSLIGR